MERDKWLFQELRAGGTKARKKKLICWTRLVFADTQTNLFHTKEPTNTYTGTQLIQTLRTQIKARRA